MIEEILLNKLLKNAIVIDKSNTFKQVYLLLESTMIYIIVKLYRTVKQWQKSD